MSNFFDQFDEPVSTGTPPEKNFFDQFDEPQPDNRIAQADAYNAELNQRMGIAEQSPAPSTEQSERGFFNNAVRGAGERAADLGGGLLNAAAAAIESAPQGGFAPGYVGQFVSREQDAKNKKLAADSLAGGADSLRATDLGYDEKRNTLDGAKAKFGAGQYLGAAAELFAAGNESMLTSAPDMVGAVGALPVYVAARSGEIANERAKNKGLDRPTQTEINEAAPFALASSLLERILPGRVLRGAGEVSEQAAKEIADGAIRYVMQKAASETGKSALIEGGTEFVQEGVIEYIGQRYGTDAAMDANEALAQGVEAAILGSIGGGTIGTAKGTYDGVSDVRRSGEQLNQDDNIDQPMNGEEIGGGIVDDMPQDTPAQTEVQQLGYNPERMVVMPDGTTAWESELPALAEQSAAAQHPGYSRITETPDEIETSLSEPVAIDDEINSMMADLDNYRSERVRQTVQPAMQKAMSDPVQSGVNPFDQFDEAPAVGLFDGVRDMRSAAANAAREQDAKRRELMSANFQEDEEGGLFSGVRALAEQSRFEPVKSEIDPGDIADIYPPDPALVRPKAEGEQRISGGLPAGFNDQRLSRPEYRTRIERMASELVKGGGVGYVRDANDRITGRTPSLNADWFKAMNENPDTSMPVADAQAAIQKALKGERLGVRQMRVVGAALDAAGEERGTYARELRALRENARADRRNAYEQWLSATNVPVDAEFESAVWPESPGENYTESDYLPDNGMEDRAIAELVETAEGFGVDWSDIDTAMEADDIGAQTQALTQLIWNARNEHRKPTTTTEQSGTASAQSGPGASEGTSGALEEEPANFAQPQAEAVTAIDAAASEAALSPLNDLPEPTEAQKEAGNYKKAHVKVKGLDIAIENPRGSTRSGTDSKGNKWETKMHSHYGYIKRTEGADGDHVDVFVGPNPDSEKVFIVDQINPDGTFDEHKVLIGFDSKLRARSGYKSNYSNGWKVGPITSMSMGEFKDWVKNGDTKKPLSDQIAGSGKMVGNQSEQALDMVPTPMSAPANDQATVNQSTSKAKIASAKADEFAETLRRNAAANQGTYNGKPLKDVALDIANAAIEDGRRLTDSEIEALSKRHEVPASVIRNLASSPVGYDYILARSETKDEGAIALRQRHYEQSLNQQPQPRAVKLIRNGSNDGVDFDATKKALPDIADGMIRLFRASSPTVKFDDVFDTEKLTEFKSPKGLTGEFYTESLAYADYFRESYGRDASINYVDVPRGYLEGRQLPADGAYIIDLGAPLGQAEPKQEAKQPQPSAGVSVSGAGISAEDAQKLTTDLKRLSGTTDFETDGSRYPAFAKRIDKAVAGDADAVKWAKEWLADIDENQRQQKASDDEQREAAASKRRADEKSKADAEAERLDMFSRGEIPPNTQEVYAEWVKSLTDAERKTLFSPESSNAKRNAAFMEWSSVVSSKKDSLAESSLPSILTQTKKQFIAGMAKERGLKKDSPGYAAALSKLEDEYTESVDRAQAELPFEKFNELNSDSPESINRQAYDALREDFGLDTGERYSLSDKREGNESITRDAAQAIIDRISKDWKVPVKIKLIDTIADLPNSIKSRMSKDDGGAEPAALIDESTGHVYINLSKVDSERSVEELVFHEVYTHFGLRQLMGDEVSTIMGRLYVSLGAAEIDRLAKKYGVNMEAYNNAYEDRPVEMRRAIIAEELLAHMAEHTKPAVVKLAQELIGAIRAWLRKNGFAELAKISESDMRYLLKQARETVTKGKNGDFTGLIYSIAGVSKSERKAMNRARSATPLPEATQELAENDDLLTAWAYMSQREETFQLPTSSKSDLVEIARDIEGMNGFVITEADELALQNDHGAENAWRIKTPGGDKASVFQKGEKVWIDVSDLESGDAGKRIYNIVANYAINTGRVFMGDPAGLSIMAKSRRLENMLSSAMKFGTTRHLQPHKLQLKDDAGVPALKWKKGDDINNIREMIITSYEAVKNQFPEIESMRYDPESDSFVDTVSGEEITDAEFDSIAGRARRRFAAIYEKNEGSERGSSTIGNRSAEGAERGQLDTSGVQGSAASSSRVRDRGRVRAAPSAGRTTLERAVLTNSILRGTRSEKSKILVQLGEQRSERLKEILYALPKTRPSGGFSVSGLQEKPIIYGIGIDSILRVWQDKMRPLLRTQNAIKEDGGTISEKENAYLAEEAFHGKTENDLRKMRERYLEPMAKRMSDYGIEREELDMYLWAKHAKERNAQIAKINPDMPDGGSGMTNAQADQILDQAKKEGKQLRLDGLAGIVYSLLDEKRKIMRHSLADDSMVDTWNNAYKYYVPLKGRAIDDSGGSYPRVGRGFDIRGKESLRALGRRTKPESPTLHAIKDTTESIIRYRKNEVGNALLALVEANPNPDYWEAYDKDSPDFERKLLKKQGEEVVGAAKVINKENYFITKRDGKEYYIRIEDPLLMRAMKNMGPEKMNWVIRQLAKVSRFLSSMVTSYNPEFVITNFSRDIQTAVLNLQAEIDLHDGKAKGKQITGKMIKSVPTAARAVYASLRNKKLGGNMADWQKSFDEFRNDGANTGWFQLLDIEQQAAELKDLMDMNKANVRGQFLKNRKRIGDFVSNINSAVENAIRLSVYKNAVDAGITRKQAASLAKNLTVNFNRKGEVGASMNALYMFFNASVQGTAAFARAMGTLKIDENGKRKLNVAQKAAIGIMFASFGLALLNRGVAGEDDDGENWWDKVPDYVKERNLVLMKSMWGGPEGEYITIPLPYGYNVFNALATTLDSGINSNKSIGESAGTMVKAMMGAFSPLGVAESDSFAGTATRTLAPTAVKPLADLAANENFFGSKIFAENFEFGTKKPDSHLHLRSTNDFWVWTAEFLNDSTGGSPYRSGLIDVSPDKMGYMFNYFVGGAGQFYSRIVHLGIKGAQDREIEATEVPFVRRFTGKVNWYPDQQKFYERKEKIDQIVDERKTLEYGSQERKEFEEKYKPMLSLQLTSKSVAAELTRLRKQRNKISDDEEMTEKEKEEKIKPIELRMQKAINRFNAAYLKAN